MGGGASGCARATELHASAASATRERHPGGVRRRVIRGRVKAGVEPSAPGRGYSEDPRGAVIPRDRFLPPRWEMFPVWPITAPLVVVGGDQSALEPASASSSCSHFRSVLTSTSSFSAVSSFCPPSCSN